MFGFLFGAAATLGVIYYFVGPRGLRGGRRGRWGGFGRRWMMESLFDRLGTRPEQERVIEAALADLQERARSTREKMSTWREDVSRLFDAEALDGDALKATLDAPDPALAELKAAAVEALAKVHAALEPDQRRTLARLMARHHGGRFGVVGAFCR